MVTQQKKQEFVDTMLARGENPERIKQFLAGSGQTLDGLVFEEKQALSANLGTGSKVAESVARTLAPKSVEGFGDTLGTALAVAGGVTDKIDKAAMDASEANFKLAQILRRTTDPAEKARLTARIRANQGSMPGTAAETIRSVNKTNKQVAAEALGTLGTVALGAKAPGGLVGRLAMGAAVGAGAGAKGALEQEMGAGDIASRTVKGGVVGLATTAAIEGAFAALKGIWHAIVPPSDAMNRGLSVPKSELTRAIEHNYKTVGEKALELTDDAGNQVYHGNPRDILGQARVELRTFGDQLDDLLASHSDVTLTRDELTQRVLGELKGEFSMLDQKEQARVMYAIGHAVHTRGTFTPAEAVEIKRFVDDLLPDNVWKVIAEGDRPRALLAKANYLIRDTLRSMINEHTDDPLIQAANNRMSLAMDMRHLAAARIAGDMLKGLPGKVVEGIKHGAVYLANSAGLQSLFEQLARGAEVLTAEKTVEKLGAPRK